MSDDNPYQAPSSEVLKQEANQYHPAVVWKFYFWINIIIALLISVLFALSFTTEYHKINWIDESFSYTFLDVFDFSLWLISLFAIYGMAWRSKKINRVFWFAFFYLFLLWAFIYGYVFPFTFQIQTYSSLTQVEDLVFELPFTFLHFYALYRYVFSMDYLWSSDREGLDQD